jgi:spermidine/putrescine transport system permease protein
MLRRGEVGPERRVRGNGACRRQSRFSREKGYSVHRASAPLNLHLGLVYLFLYAPIAVLMVLSFNKGGMPTAWTGVSLGWYVKLVHSPEIISSAINTLIVAVCSTLIATVLGTLLALGVEKRRRSSALDALLFAPMIIPDIVLAIALLSFFTLLELTLGLYSIILSHAVFNIAFVCAVVRTRLRNFDHSIVEASIDLGAGEFTTFRRVTLPVIFPGVLAGALLAFTLSFDEFIIAYFTAGAGSSSTTLPMRIYSMIRFGVTPEINAMATIVMLVSFTLVFFSQRANRGALAGE